NRYLNFYLEDSPALSNEDLYQLYKQLLPTLTLGEVDAIGESFYIDTNRDVIIMAPDQEKENLPDQQQVDGWFEEVEREAVGVYEDKVSDLPLISKEPQAGKVAAEKKDRKSTRLNSSHVKSSYAVFGLKKIGITSSG